MFDAAVSSHSSLAPSSSQPRFHFTPPFNNHSAATLNLPITHLKRCRIRIVSSINPTTNNYTNFQAVLPDKFPEASLSTPDSSPSLPRPLSSSIASNSDGSRLRVAYQGVSGAYSELAAETAYPNCEAVPCDQFDTAFEAVERWLVDRAVLPIENSLGGSIHRNYDLLLRHRLHIVGEVKLPIRHCLLANPGVKIDDLKRVLSHPQALAQCEHTLAKFGVTREAVDDTAGAAKFVAYNELKDAGAVASAAAARIYGLNILAEDIQDDSDNVTRFLMLAREPIIPGSDRPFKNALRHLEEFATLLRVLGSYPADTRRR